MLTTTRFLREVAAKYGTAPTSFEEAAQLPQSEFFNLLEDYYLNNGLYWLLEELLLSSSKANFDNRRAIRNPCHAAVEFYAGKLWPGQVDRALPLVTENANLADPIKQIYQWSNWGQNKQILARKFSMLGTMLIKVNVNTDRTRVYLQLIDPRVIPPDGFKLDERGFLSYLRMDIRQDTPSGEDETWWTEIWHKFPGNGVSYQLYIHSEGFGAELDDLGAPVAAKMTGEPVTEETADAFLPFDFIPVVFIPFRDIGHNWGLGCYVQVLDKIDEANLLATRLHSLIYNTDAVWALSANARDAQGRPMPAPDVQMAGQPAESTILKIGSMKLVKLPGTSQLQPLVPQLDFASLLAVVQDQIREIERDLPEARYYRIAEQAGELSGRAIELLLGDAVDRALEARGNGEEGIKRALQMALTLGVVYGIIEGKVGSFAAGDFEFHFKDRPVINPTLKELFEVVKLGVDAGITVEVALKLANFDQTIIDETAAANEAAAARQQEQLAAAVLKAQAANKPPVGQEETDANTDTDIPEGDE